MGLFLIDGKQFFQTGNIIKLCGLYNAWYEDVDNPKAMVASLKKDRHGSHIFTFFQRPPHVEPKYGYYMEPYPVSVIKFTSYEAWWNNSIGKKTRYGVKKAYKEGVEIRIVNFDDALIKGISDIYNETPLRAGKAFPHYNDSLEKVREENGTFLDRSVFLGAYYKNELIGFTKIVFENEFADILQHLSKIAHQDKCSSNALLAKAIEVCLERRAGYLAYGDWDASGVGDFKRHNGFSQMILPRYFIPLNWIGAIALKFKLHQPINALVPEKAIPFLKDMRYKWYKMRHSRHLISK